MFAARIASKPIPSRKQRVSKHVHGITRGIVKPAGGLNRRYAVGCCDFGRIPRRPAESGNVPTGLCPKLVRCTSPLPFTVVGVKKWVRPIAIQWSATRRNPPKSQHARSEVSRHKEPVPFRIPETLSYPAPTLDVGSSYVGLPSYQYPRVATPISSIIDPDAGL
ncbi:hypothetical protein KCP69_22725 [Salmonella enterica subsp. enterica]|nr:hypothetical protein KCP69_22725 [Salmonella enterica subsp. enterica]